MRVARFGLFVLSVAAILSLPAFADQTTPSSTPPPDQSTTTAAPAQTTTAPPPAQTPPATPQQPPNAPPTGPQSLPNPAPTPKPTPAQGPMQIKVNENVNFRFGLLLQPQLDLGETSTGSTSQNMLLRRTRFLVSGQLAKKTFFFFQTENARLGNATTSSTGTTTKAIATGFQTIDAVAEYRYSKPLNLWIGLIYLPTSREALKSSASQFLIDQNTYAYTATGVMGGTGGRDTGFMARGYFAGDHLEYRAGVFSGLRTNQARNAFRKIARLQWNFLDTEPYVLPSYPGAYYGTKKIVALGAAYDTQQDYKAPTADLYVDLPTGFGSVLGTVTYMSLDGGVTVPSFGKSKVFVIDGGAFLKSSKIGPWLRYENRDFSNPNKSKSEKRYVAGVNWMPYLSNFNIKAALSRLSPEVGKKLNEYIVQLQFFIY